MHALKLLGKHFLLALLLAAIAQSLLALVLRPGCLSIDEATYHAMLRGLARGSLGFDNGYSETPSPELEWEFARAVSGRVVAQYPHGMPVLALPFYRLFGLRGVALLDTWAFFGTAFVTYALAFRLFGKRTLAALAGAVFVLCTYSWEYSFAVWPHALTTFLTTSALALAIHAEGPSRASPTLVRLSAGALAGLAVTTRLDAAFAIPGLLVVPAFFASSRSSQSSRSSLGASGVVALGTLPALAFLSLTNHAKFGTWQPFSYGPWYASGGNAGGIAAYVPLGVVAGIGLIAAHLVVPRASSVSRRTWLAVVVAAVVVVAIAPTLRHAVLRTVDGAWFLLLDLRHGDVHDKAAALGRSSRGAMMYVGALKKSLVQSLPWLPLAVLGALARGQSRSKRLALAVPILAYAAVFCFFAWHGGLCLNMRYLLPILPMAAILATYGAHRILRHAPRLLRIGDIDARVLGVVAAIFAFEVVAILPSSVDVHEMFYLDGSLVLTALLAGAIALRRQMANIALALGAIAFVWASTVEFAYDAPAIRKARAHHLHVADVARQWIPPASLVVAEFPDPASDLQEDGVVVADAQRDRFADTFRLAAARSKLGKDTFLLVFRDTYLARFEGKASKLGEVDGFVVARVQSRSSDRR